MNNGRRRRSDTAKRTSAGGTTSGPMVALAALVATTSMVACESAPAPEPRAGVERDFLHSIGPSGALRTATETPMVTAPTSVTEHRSAIIPGDPGPSPTLHAQPPHTGRVIRLFDGTGTDAWRQRDGASSQWVPQDDGSVLVRGGDAITRESFGSFQLHLEFLCPDMPEKSGQSRANSGVYLHGRYEVQVLDTFGQEPFPGGCGGIYSIAPPLVNASRPPGHFQTYDIYFRAPEFDATDTMTAPAVVTVVHNGIVVHNNLPLPHATPGGLDEVVAARGPILLQDHGDPVLYRNVWVRPLD